MKTTRAGRLGWIVTVVLLLASPVLATPCAGDVDGDGAVTFEDLLAVLAAWGACPGCPEDVDGDDEVAFADLLVVLAAWGPCSFDYGPPRENAEAEQIALESLGPAGPLLAPDDVYERFDRDLGLIRSAIPALAGETHAMAWAPNQIIVQRDPGVPADAYEEMNRSYGVLDEDNIFADWYLLTLPGNVNVPRLATLYMALDHVLFAEPNGFIGGQNFWRPAEVAGDVVRWDVDDGFHDCFDGCDCHRLYVIDVDAAGAVTLVSYTESGLPWCEF